MYRGIEHLRHESEEVEIGEDEINEIIHCKNNIKYFAEKYCHIITLDDGLRLVDELYPFQKEILQLLTGEKRLDNKSRSMILRAARQTGKCVSGDTMIKIRNKHTKEILEITFKDFYELIK